MVSKEEEEAGENSPVCVHVFMKTRVVQGVPRGNKRFQHVCRAILNRKGRTSYIYIHYGSTSIRCRDKHHFARMLSVLATDRARTYTDYPRRSDRFYVPIRLLLPTVHDVSYIFQGKWFFVMTAVDRGGFED